MTLHVRLADSTTTTSGTAATTAPRQLDDDTVLPFDADEMEVGSTRLARVDGRRVCIARTEEGIFAVDHACPHEGYGLTQRSLDGSLLTCAWHNWKFDVRTGDCVQGEEGVPAHDVDVADDGSIRVRVRVPSPEHTRTRLLQQLRRGIEQNYVGQIARDVARLLEVGTDPYEIAAVGVRHGAARAEYGWGHSIAALSDCLAMLDLFDGEQRAVPLVQGLSFTAETERGRPEQPLADAAPFADATRAAFLDAVEYEDLPRAQALIRAAIARGDDPSSVHDWFIGAISAHHLSYGHGAIYVQKGFELLTMIGWEHADVVLGHLVTSVVTGTREDTLPYHRPFARSIDDVDLEAVAAAAEFADVPPPTGAADALVELRAALLGPDRGVAARSAVTSLTAGAPVDAVLDTVVGAVAERLLRYDPANETDLDDDFNWLDITHGITYAHAVRHHLAAQRDAGRLDVAADASARARVELIRLLLFAAFQANWTGRHEWHTAIAPTAPSSLDPRLVTAGSDRVALAAIGDDLQRRSLDDVHTAPIHVVHAVKTSRAAHLEAQRTGDGDVLAATTRYFDGPRSERSVRAATHRAIEFVGGRLRR
ncbi:MAG: Rieske 2Fe-2S domain-containing protein [Actinomycetota bacterium]